MDTDIYAGNEFSLLTDLEILERLVESNDEKCIFISPLIHPGIQLGPSSLDIHLGTEMTSTQISSNESIDLTKNKAQLESIVDRYTIKKQIGPGDHYVLHPGEFTLASTLEYIKLPLDIAGRLEGRSSIGRLGLQVHATAGFVDPGFEGTLTFEFINSGKLPLIVKPGLRLGQICFFKTNQVQVGYMDKPGSKYGGHMGTESSRIYHDPEIGE